jgi:RNA polymerase sigma-70 factor (ECF subfamily)
VTAAARAGAPEDEFSRVSEPFRRELWAHCYRMVGSVHDAEDLVQETYLQAWRAFGRFEGRSSVRTWLYRIATRACLKALQGRARRPLPSGLGAPADPDRARGSGGGEVPWLEPAPDALLAADPAAVVEARQTLRLAFVAALQHLPGRQRAVLILRDVLAWRADEVAALLGSSTAAVNSALQRARERLRDVAPAEAELAEPAGPARRAMLDRYAAAFENADLDALTALLTDDAVWEMPPVPEWFAGRAAVVRFLSGRLVSPGGNRMVPVRLNGQPGFAAYARGADGAYRAHALHVLTVAPAGVARVVAFLGADLFGPCGLPAALPGRA